MKPNPLRDFLRALECVESAWTVQQWLNELTADEKKGLAPCLSVVMSELASK